ncbi:MAG: ribosome maturation factor RimM [Dysgonamonadaceae bacterium]|jgi:16S rRNA processing protein RimM|nr:ribosome maturation factor RimM [Dysgonamonadaceae bacterium]
MIQREELIKIGRFNKPHGVKGELSCTFSNTAFEETENAFLICELDGIFVPFRLEEYRFTSGSTALLRLKTIVSEQKAKLFTNKEVYFPKNKLTHNQSSDYTSDYFIGFSLIDEKRGTIGSISAIDDSTLNTLFIIETGTDELLIPASEDMILRIDEAQKQIHVKLPEGILEIN